MAKVSMGDCDACRVGGVEPIPRWKAPLMFVAFLLFCPCHLPVTFGAVAAVGGGLTGAYWLFGNQALVYTTFGLIYLAVVAALFAWFVKYRDQEKAHLAHAVEA